MFCLKAIFFVAVLSAVNGAVTVNIYGDDGKDITAVAENLQEVHGCTNPACDFLCRLMNFPGGRCVNGGCKCNNRKQTEDDEEELHLERSLQETHRCNNEACDQLCRRMNFPFGVCLNGRCKCDDFKELEDSVAENVKDLGSCDWRACDQLCRRLGFPGGVCVGDKCKCDNFRQNNNEYLLNDNDLSANELENANECNNAECVSYCQKLGLPSGYCYQDRCICYKKKEKVEAYTLQRCDVVACNEMCHRLNYIGGMCRNGSCYCY